MTDARGTFEHALFDVPRPEHGYCTDDMARVLVVAAREPKPSAEVGRLVRVSLQFLHDAQGPNGGYRNRLDAAGRWLDVPTTDDCWGRSIWALGTAVSHSADGNVRAAATAQLARPLLLRSRWPRAMAYAAIGAAEVLDVQPHQHAARRLLEVAADAMAPPRRDAEWPWPEERLRYANAVLPEGMIAAGATLERPGLVAHGLELLAWLLDHETLDGHLSVTPATGAGPGDRGPAFDQQPIEVAALAEACARAARVDGDRRWADGVADAAAWFSGNNDLGLVMRDAATGGAFDGLHADRVNLNQGAESTLALVSTLQHARQLAPAAA